MKKLSAQILAAFALCASAFAQENAITLDVKQSKTDIGYADSVILGLVEGVTEYLPVSSTGHLIITDAILGLDREEPVLDANNNVITNRDGDVFTMKSAVDAYVIVIQFGAIAAVALLYWEYILKMLLGVFGKNREGLRLFRNLMIAFIPAAGIGFFLHKIIESALFGVKPVIFALAAGAVLMFAVQKVYDKNLIRSRTPKMEDLSVGQSLFVGLLQCVAMWPGTSRSMMTIMGGYLAGLKPAESAKFSFLLGFVTLSAASLFKTFKDGHAMIETLSVGPLALGMVVAFVSAAFSVKWLIGFLTRRGMIPFAWYRLFVAAVLCAMLYFGAL